MTNSLSEYFRDSGIGSDVLTVEPVAELADSRVGRTVLNLAQELDLVAEMHFNQSDAVTPRALLFR